MNWAMIGAALAALAVACGAFGSHGLADAPQKAQQWWEIAARYHFFHALALFAWGLAGRRGAAPWLWLAGTLLFSGTLYLLAVAGWRPHPLLTPLGGFLMIGGWLAAAGALWRKR